MSLSSLNGFYSLHSDLYCNSQPIANRKHYIITLYGGEAGSEGPTENSPLSDYLWQWVIMQGAIISYKQLTLLVRGENYDL